MKAKVLKAEYREENDIIIFTILDIENDKEQAYCWPSSDYLEHVIGVKADLVDAENLHEHCKEMKDKEINFEIRGEPANVEPKIDLEKKKEIDEAIANECDSLLDAAREIQEFD